MEDKPTLDRATFEFSQDSNCVDGGDPEILMIRCESSLGIDNDKESFFILETKQWSINSPQELVDLLKRVESTIKHIIKENE